MFTGTISTGNQQPPKTSAVLSGKTTARDSTGTATTSRTTGMGQGRQNSSGSSTGTTTTSGSPVTSDVVLDGWEPYMKFLDDRLCAWNRLQMIKQKKNQLDEERIEKKKTIAMLIRQGKDCERERDEIDRKLAEFESERSRVSAMYAYADKQSAYHLNKCGIDYVKNKQNHN